jgi:DNA-binding beta-propeller fold protein YncE
VDIGPDGHVWVYDRCGGNCDRNNVDPIYKFDRDTGKVLAAFGAGVLFAPHGFHVDRQGNVWVTDFLANDARTKGHQVIKFSASGAILMRLGQPGVAGDGPGQFNQPTDVITAPNGDIFVADGHNGADPRPPAGATGRILKFSADGRFIKQWGRIGNAPGEFRTPHGLAFDSRGRLFVADRGNHRIQIFDQEGTYIDSYYQFGRVSGLFITSGDALYAIDSESDEATHPGWRMGIRIGKAAADVVTAFIPPHAFKDKPAGVAGEGVAVDDKGNVYVAEGPGSRPAVDGALTKYFVNR